MATEPKFRKIARSKKTRTFDTFNDTAFVNNNNNTSTDSNIFDVNAAVNSDEAASKIAYDAYLKFREDFSKRKTDVEGGVNFENIESTNENETIKLEELAHFDGVLVTVPTIFVNCASDTRDDVTDRRIVNIRAINYKQLCDLIDMAIQIDTNDYEQQLELTEKLTNRLLTVNPTSGDDSASKCLELIRMLCQTIKNIDIDDIYVNATNEGINLDPIRRYENYSDTGLLKSADKCCWRGASFYSQLDPETALIARKECNDTELNQIYFIMTRLEDALLFRTDRILNRTVDIVNIALFYLNLHACSRPVENHCANNLQTHLIGYVVDVVVRSRLTSAWKKQRAGKFMLSDISRNYPANHPIVVVCRLDTPRERAQKLLQLLSAGNQSKDIASLLNNLSYDIYETQLAKTVHRIEGQDYYLFDAHFIKNIAAMEGFAALQSLNLSQMKL